MKKRFDSEGLKNGLKSAGIALKNALFPEDITCDVCGAELIEDTRYRLCSSCVADFPFVGEHVCLNCGAPIDNEATYCDSCQNRESVIRMNRAAFRYEGLGKKIIHDFKFDGKKYLVRTISAMMCDVFINNGMEGEIIVPVPMTEKDEKKRGFNQSELLAVEIGKRLGIPVLPALVKIKDTQPQKELNKRDREENLKGAFDVVFPQVKDRRILLVDDIYTIGATVNECAKTLLKARCKSVSSLTAGITVFEKHVD